MKGVVLKTDDGWYIEIQSDLHGYGVGWGDPIRYPLIIDNENIQMGDVVEAEVVEYDSNTFLPSKLKVIKPIKNK
jgi:hypothetical protein